MSEAGAGALKKIVRILTNKNRSENLKASEAPYWRNRHKDAFSHQANGRKQLPEKRIENTPTVQRKPMVQ